MLLRFLYEWGVIVVDLGSMTNSVVRLFLCFITFLVASLVLVFSNLAWILT